ncbi:general stress protein [Leptolyngbya sp. CCNP1308]|uniref:general stress protein n=1 Tax=Leptolyngbya sp. CCNP1308 TaxID=3110255 RepID=UPI002B21D865|nr:general stress protein [Leptolyngbya sp. CCNP1308]MEA5451635.1 general stress protein [Leptolyngbya sp. CCNP1308]
MASQHRRAVGVFSDRPKTASALQTLSDSGFAMDHVSVIAKDSDRQSAIAGIEVKSEVSTQANTAGAVGAVTGGVLGGVTGLLVGLGTLVIPGIGPAVLAGEAAVAISALIGGAAGAAAGGLVGALIGLGIPEHRAKRYRDRVAQGEYLVMLKDTEPEIARAERTLKAAGIEDWGVYQVPADAPAVTSGSPNATFDGTAGVAPGRDNPYNQVDHPSDDRYPHGASRQATDLPPATGLPHASNPLEP